MSQAPRVPDEVTPPTRWFAEAALILAFIGMAGSLYLSTGLGLKACPLCFYQRTFVMGALGVLAVGLWVERRRPGLICLLALPLATGGLGVAAFHEYLVLAGKLECPLGLFGLGTAPAQSLALFVLLFMAILAGTWLSQADVSKPIQFVLPLAIALGGIFAWGCIASAPAPEPTKLLPDGTLPELKMCRPPYKAASR